MSNVALSDVKSSNSTLEALPPELRNLIYQKLFQIENDDTHVTNANGRTVHNTDISLQGIFSPYFIWTQPSGQAREHQRREFATDFIYKAGAVFLKDPVIWQISRQIRNEAMSVYLEHTLSFDLRGYESERLPMTIPAQVGLQNFKRWWSSMHSAFTSSIRSVEIRDFVDIVYPSTPEQPCMANLDTGDEDGGSWPCFLAALEVVISKDGRRLSIKTPLELVAAQRRLMSTYLETIACRKTAESKVFDGGDIYDFICWYRTRGDEWPMSLTMEEDDQEVTVLWRMWGTNEDVEYLNNKPWFKVKKQFQHAAVDVQISPG